MTTTPLKPETGEGYVIKMRGASKKDCPHIAMHISNFAVQYSKRKYAVYLGAVRRKITLMYYFHVI
jgi:hypothetical protein